MNSDHEIEELIELIQSLPEEYQKAILWMIKYYDSAVEFLKAGPLGEEQRAQWMEKAKEKNDALLIVLLILEKQVNTDTES